MGIPYLFETHGKYYFHLLLVVIFADNTPQITRSVTHFTDLYGGRKISMSYIYPCMAFYWTNFDLFNYSLVSIYFPISKCIHFCVIYPPRFLARCPKSGKIVAIYILNSFGKFYSLFGDYHRPLLFSFWKSALNFYQLYKLRPD